MIEKANGRSTEAAHHALVERINEIYASGDPSEAQEVTKLLVNALRRPDYRSRSALQRFFDVSTMAQTRPASKLDLVLIARTRLFITGLNAHRVQVWISGYEGSAPRSERRLMYERILRDFVASSSEVKTLKSQVRNAHLLAADLHFKCDALTRLIRTIPGIAGVSANRGNGRTFSNQVK